MADGRLGEKILVTNLANLVQLFSRFEITGFGVVGVDEVHEETVHGLLVATRRARYRQALTELFTAVSSGILVPPHPWIASLAEYPEALSAAANAEPGEKTILTLAGW